MRYWPQLLMGLVVTSASWVVVAQESAEEWLQKMITASHQASFQGRSVLLSGGRLISLAVLHAPIEGEVWERVIHLSGEPAEIIRQGDRTVSVHQQHSAQISTDSTSVPNPQPHPVDNPMNKWDSIQRGIQTASRYYRFNLVGTDRVAGRNAILIDVEPRDLNRYGYSLWLDQASGVLLRSQTNPKRGDPLEVFEFVELSIDDSLSEKDFQPAAGLHMPNQSGGQQALQPLVLSDMNWQADWIPEGFVEASESVLSSGHTAVNVRTYSDGLAAFTVFYEATDKPVAESTSSRGATVAVNRNIGNKLVTVVGEIPVATAEKIADNVKILAAGTLKR